MSWMDDICLPGGKFETKLLNLRRFFTRCRETSLSLSPSKSKLFMTEVLFAGAMVGPSGIKPNLDKVAAVVDWPVPEDAQDLLPFLGLTNYFQRLINDYTRIAAPLKDLTRNIEFQKPKGTSLTDKWTPECQKVVLALRILLSQEPILRSPQYNRRVFRVTTDGSGKGFAG